MKSKKLQPYFAAWWVAWIIGTATIAMLDPGIWWHRAVLIVFTPPELWAAFRDGGGALDTLSEFVQYIGSWAPKTAKALTDWRAVPGLIAFLISYEAAYVFSWGAGSEWTRPYLGIPLAALAFVWLLFHWSHRVK